MKSRRGGPSSHLTAGGVILSATHHPFTTAKAVSAAPMRHGFFAVTFTRLTATGLAANYPSPFAMKNTLLPILAVAAVTVFFCPSASRAADDPAPEHPRMQARADRIAKALELTDDQRHALKDVVRMHQPVLQPLMQEARKERQSLRSLSAADTLDDAALAAQADRIAATQKQIVIASAHLRADLRKVLTPEQLKKIQRWRARADQRVQGGQLKFLEMLATG